MKHQYIQQRTMKRPILPVQCECESEGSSLCPWEKWQIISFGPGVNGRHTLSRPTFPFQFSAQRSWCMWRITWQDQSPSRLTPASCYSLARVPLWPCVSACGRVLSSGSIKATVTDSKAKRQVRRAQGRDVIIKEITSVCLLQGNMSWQWTYSVGNIQ